MKTKMIHIVLLISGLCIPYPIGVNAQNMPFSVYRMENVPEMPALSCFSTSFAGIGFRNDFGTKEMMYADISGVVVRNRNALICHLFHYGYSEYGNMQLSLGYGRNFGDRFALSVRLFYLLHHARGYPARHSLCADVSVAIPITSKLCVTASAYNPFVLHYGVVGKEVIPLKFTLGGVYAPTEKLLFSVSMAKMLPGAWEIGGQFITQPLSPLLVAAECANTHLGLSIYLVYKRFIVSVKAAWYYRISVSPEIGGFYCLDDAMM